MNAQMGKVRSKTKARETSQQNAMCNDNQGLLPEGKGTEKKQDKEKRDEQSTVPCAMRSVKTCLEQEIREYYYKVMKLRCYKV